MMLSKFNELFNKNQNFWDVTNQEWEQNRSVLMQKFQEENLPISEEKLDSLRKEAIEQKNNSIQEYEAGMDTHVFSNEFDGFYSLKEDGVYFFEKNANGFGLKICDYLAVTELFTTSKSEVGRGLTWRNEYTGKPISKYFYNDEIYDTKNLIKVLIRMGFKVLTVSSRRNYLYDYINSCIPEQRSFMVTAPGWVSLDKKHYAYVRPGLIVGYQPVPLIAPETIDKENCKSIGLLSEWQEIVGKPALSSSRAVFACSVVLASTCLKFMKETRLRVGFNFVGSSTSGKSLAMMIGLSVAGLPQSLSKTWWGSKSGLTATVKERNDFICALDEMSTLANKEEAPEIAYVLLGGQEKNRANTVGNRLKESNDEWNVMLLSTGEEGLVSLSRKTNRELNTGAELRLLDIPLPANGKLGVNEYLPEGFESIQDYALQMNENIDKYHGVVFQVFMNCLCSKLNDPNNVNAVKDLKDTIHGFTKKFVEKYAKGKTSQVKIAAYCFGFVAAVGDLACGGSDGYLCKGSIFGWKCSSADRAGAIECAAARCFKDWLGQFEADKATGEFCIEEGDDKETQKILRRTYDFINTKRPFFVFKDMNKAEYEKTFKRDCLGYYEDIGIQDKYSSELKQQRIFYLTPHSFDTYIVAHSNKSQVINILKRKNIINQDKTTTKRMKCEDNSIRVWTLKLP